MSKKLGIYLTDSSQSVLEQYGEASSSSLVNMVIERYQWVLKSSLPELTNDEWTALLNVYSGSEMTSYNPPYRISSDMMDDAGALELSELVDDYATLVKKMHALSQVEQCAVLDFCQRYWSGNWAEFDGFDRIKAELAGLV